MRVHPHSVSWMMTIIAPVQSGMNRFTLAKAPEIAGGMYAAPTNDISLNLLNVHRRWRTRTRDESYSLEP